MKKSFYALFLCVLCVLMMANCTAGSVLAENSDQIFQTNAYRIVRKYHSSGQIQLSYIFPANSEFLLQNFSQEDATIFTFYLANYVVALAKSNQEKVTDGVTVSGCEYYTDIDGIGFSIVFDDMQSQSDFFGESENSSSQNLKTSGFFVKKTTLETSFPISSQQSADSLRAICTYSISSWALQCDISEKDKALVLEQFSKTNFIYDFSTYQSGLKSELMYQDSLYHNVFVKTYAQIESDSEIVFWTSSVDKGLCYIFAVLFVLFCMLLWFLVAKLQKKL